MFFHFLEGISVVYIEYIIPIQIIIIIISQIKIWRFRMPQFPTPLTCDLLCISIENKLSFIENACDIGALLCARQISRHA